MKPNGQKHCLVVCRQGLVMTVADKEEGKTDLLCILLLPDKVLSVRKEKQFRTEADMHGLYGSDMVYIFSYNSQIQEQFLDKQIQL